ncbi:hypothetical protein BLNAU_1883 [Blattamonas nauphoetae]|uniref:Uncharacterized protein n=1 Tax=Blattamonas nauphoetae TaxID=2049346 RepID=A0ABQ9YID1_9EUKA|nr:hypothetical protein BLNAU_1883 [Blattamonas nauphoetae]
MSRKLKGNVILTISIHINWSTEKLHKNKYQKQEQRSRRRLKISFGSITITSQRYGHKSSTILHRYWYQKLMFPLLCQSSEYLLTLNLPQFTNQKRTQQHVKQADISRLTLDGVFSSVHFEPTVVR